MYNPADVAQRIKDLAKHRNISVKQMLDDCELNKNVLSTMSARGSMPKTDNIARIADYLGCSMDYLLGRSDSPEKTAPGTPGADEVDEEFIDEFSVRYFSLTPESRKVILELMDRLLDGQEK